MSGHKHRRKFSQNFLVDEGILIALVESIAPRASDFFLEIGPGEGVLTRHLLDAGSKVCAIEIDRDLVAALNKKQWDRFDVIESDVLAVDFAQFESAVPIRCVGNLPYHISTPVIFQCFDFLDFWQDMYFLLQKEVVMRLAAAVGSKHYGRLSVMAQAMCEVRCSIEVPPSAFNPPPKVDSQVVHMIPRKQEERCFDLAALSHVVRTAFAHRRKTLHNNFKGVLQADDWEHLEINPKCRAQELQVADFIRLANHKRASDG